MASASPRRAVAAAAITIVLALAVIGVYAWLVLGDSEMSLTGYLAFAFGVIATVGLGVGLMALVYYSNRRGYDDQVGLPPDRHTGE